MSEGYLSDFELDVTAESSFLRSKFLVAIELRLDLTASIMQQLRFLPLLLIATLSPCLAESEDDFGADLWTGSQVNLGNMFFPHLHISGAVGASSEDDLESLAGGDHDPTQNVNLLALEPGFSLRLGDHIEGFITSSYRTDGEGDFTGGIEEAFVKLTNLPGDFELRGGRYFNRVGFQNARHSHAWDYVDQYLANARILQEGEMASVGGELTWLMPTRYPSAFSLSVGGPPGGHSHGHGHEEEGHEEEEHHDEDEDGHDEDEHEMLEADGANFDDYVVSANLLGTWRYNDFHQFTGNLNFSFGENEFDELTRIYGAGLEYLWRENGLEAGGRYVRLRTEAMYRDFKAGHEDEPKSRYNEFGFYSSATYGFNDNWEASLRAGYVEGIDDAGLQERWRVSPALTWSLNRERNMYMRLQYNYDHRSELADAHTVWLGFGINWGGSEVR